MKEYNINDLVPLVERIVGNRLKIIVSPLEITVEAHRSMGHHKNGSIQFLIPHNVVKVTASIPGYDELMRLIAGDIESNTKYEVIYVNPPILNETLIGQGNLYSYPK